MNELYVEFQTGSPTSVLTPHGVFVLANPDAVVPGRTHLIRYHPLDQFAVVAAIRLYPIDRAGRGQCSRSGLTN